MLAADVAVAPASANRVGVHKDALDHQKRIALIEAPVFINRRLALFAVVDQVLWFCRGGLGRLPLSAGWESRTTTTGQPRRFDLVDDLILGHRREDLVEGAEAATGHVLIEADRIS